MLCALGLTALLALPIGATPEPTASTPAATPGLPATTAAPAAPGGPAATPPTWWEDDSATGNWGGFRDTLKNEGVSIVPSLTSEVFGNPSGGKRRGVITDGVADVTLDLDLSKMSDASLFADTVIHAYALYIYGPNLSTSYVGDFSITSNLAGYNSVRLQELWLQKQFWSKRVSVKVGNIAVDTEFFQSASAALFLSGTFGSFTLIANNVPNAPVYPLASPGVRVQFLPTPQTYVMAGVFGMDNGSNMATNNQDGLRFALNGQSGMLVMSEAGYLLNQGPKDKGLQGSYRIGSWLDTGNFSAADVNAPNFREADEHVGVGANYGVYGVLDQQIFAQGSEIISLFVRAGSAPSNVNFVDWYAEGGFNFTGFVPGRDKDIGGIGIARSHVSPDFSHAAILQGEPGFTAETVLEATYKMQLNPWWYVQPDFQYIITPSGEQYSHNATVLGLRSGVTF